MSAANGNAARRVRAFVDDCDLAWGDQVVATLAPVDGVELALTIPDLRVLIAQADALAQYAPDHHRTIEVGAS